MAGTVYLKTNRFEVTLEGITFRTKDFESLCTLDFLFAERKTWAHKPIVGLDIIRHPRNPKTILLLLCIGTGCVILRLHAGKALPGPILKFFRDERINFVGFGIQDKFDLLSLKELVIKKKFVDVGYLAAKRFNDSKYKRSKLADLARKILGIKKMVGLTDASSFERYEAIKCAICQLFITSVIGMTLLGSQDKKKLEDAPKKMPSLSVEEWLNVPKVEKKDHQLKTIVDQYDQLKTIVDQYDPNLTPKGEEGDQNESRPIHEFADDSLQSKERGGFFDGLDQEKGVENKRYSDSFVDKRVENYTSDDSYKYTSGGRTPSKTPLKGILKCPSTNTNKLEVQELSSPNTNSTPKSQLRRANSKGYNVSFAFTLSE